MAGQIAHYYDHGDGTLDIELATVECCPVCGQYYRDYRTEMREGDITSIYFHNWEKSRSVWCIWHMWAQKRVCRAKLMKLDFDYD